MPTEYDLSCLYDAGGMRTFKQSTTYGVTLFVSQYFDMRLNGNKTSSTKHFFAGDTRIASEAVTVSAGNTYTSTSTKTFFFHQDHLGSTSMLTDDTGAPREYLQYFADGDVWIDKSVKAPENGYTFSGKFFDPETGLYNFGARFYDPKTSLWLGVDPAFSEDSGSSVGRPMTLSAYAYASWNFIARIDPDGRDDQPVNKPLQTRKNELTDEFLLAQEDIQYMLVLSFERNLVGNQRLEPGFLINVIIDENGQTSYKIVDQPSTGTEAYQAQDVSLLTAVFAHYHGKYVINGQLYDAGPYPSNKYNNVMNFDMADEEQADRWKARVWVASQNKVTEYDPITKKQKQLVDPNDWENMKAKYGAKAHAQALQEKSENDKNELLKKEKAKQVKLKEKEEAKQRRQLRFNTGPIDDYWRALK